MELCVAYPYCALRPSPAWWHMPVVPALGRMRQENCWEKTEWNTRWVQEQPGKHLKTLLKESWRERAVQKRGEERRKEERTEEEKNWLFLIFTECFIYWVLGVCVCVFSNPYSVLCILMLPLLFWMGLHVPTVLTWYCNSENLPGGGVSENPLISSKPTIPSVLWMASYTSCLGCVDLFWCLLCEEAIAIY